MADYFTHLCCLLDVGCPEKAVRAIDFFVALRDEDDQSDEPQFHGFDLSLQDGPKSSVLWIRDDESGNVEAVTAFILHLAEELDLSGLWGFAGWLIQTSQREDRRPNQGGGLLVAPQMTTARALPALQISIHAAKSR